MNTSSVWCWEMFEKEHIHLEIDKFQGKQISGAGGPEWPETQRIKTAAVINESINEPLIDYSRTNTIGMGVCRSPLSISGPALRQLMVGKIAGY